VSAQPTIKDVAALAGVAVGTVSNTINSPELVSPDKRQRVLDAIARLGWMPRSDAQTLASKDPLLVTATASATWPQAASSFRGEVDLDIEGGSQAAQALTVQLAAQEASVEVMETGQTRLTLQLHADTVGQAAILLIGIVLPLNRQVLRLQVTGAEEYVAAATA
jgi:DNA-binding LacI/PurR family transcriptional regulator